MRKIISAGKIVFREVSLFYVSVSLLLIQRFFHFKGQTEEPMAWRQFDTEFYAYDFFKNGINLFKPSVCWLGAHKTLILEFPLISGVISIFYTVFGHSIFYARLVIFLFYLGSAFYLFLIIKHLYYARIAKLALLIYLMMPLSLYYSRAINIDFPALFFALAMLYYLILGYDKSNFGYIAIGTGSGIIAFLIKAPFAFYLFIPLLYHVFEKKKLSLFLKTLPLLALIGMVFLFWENYVSNTNSGAPDWFFIPDYFKFTNMSDWYFGYLEQRFIAENWKTLFYRFVESTTTYIGIPFFIFGLFAKPENGFKKTFFYFYLTGLFIYLLIFFSLNVIHEYYQIPLLIVSSFFIALSLDLLYRKLREKSLLVAKIFIYFLLVLLMINSIWFTERWYYKIDKVRLYASEEIKKNTEENSLVIVSIKDTDPRDPRILAPSYRYGWSIRLMDLNKDIILRLIQSGAKYLAIIANCDLDDKLVKYLDTYPGKELGIREPGWKLYLYKLE